MMSSNPPDPAESFLSRWSRRKLEAARDAPAVPVATQVPSGGAPVAVPQPMPVGASTAASPEPPPLPPVETLTFDSDFTAFLKPGVEPAVQRAALRKLLHDSRFNVMDGLDTYIDDYTKPSPLDPAIARTLAHAQAFFAPPRTRVNAQGVVEDVPTDEVQASAADAARAHDDAPPPALGADAARANDATPPAADLSAQPAVSPTPKDGA